ncbi:hypothetical protein DZF99_04280 [Clavibacter phaseoli]|nr:hypothetical protein DZF99_04280 [Clavibacter phaseoli]RIJ60803.1 hypothetical protein DZG03_00865 [Clavibacter phaseoli]
MRRRGRSPAGGSSRSGSGLRPPPCPPSRRSRARCPRTRRSPRRARRPSRSPACFCGWACVVPSAFPSIAWPAALVDAAVRHRGAAPTTPTVV